MVDLTGKVALVTGGGRGIGRGIALVLASRGASVIIGDINGDSAQAVAQEIEGMGYTALAITMDVTSAASVTKALLAVDSQLGAVDVLANKDESPARSTPIMLPPKRRLLITPRVSRQR